ncbi:MAG TPA: M1 family aminopeptidase, partial [Geobacteraceae bacterium]
AGNYRVRERSADGIPVYTYFTAQNDSLAERYLAATVKYLRAYRKLFGPYPFPKFAVVENFFPTGYGFPSFTLIGGSILRLPFIVDTSLPHEIAHSWWGNGVLVDDTGGNWSEGLVTYLADYAAEARRSARAAASYRFRILSDYASVVPPDKDFPLRNFGRRSDPASHSIGYGKGAMLFHMVRNEIGDKAFYEALRRVVADKLFKPATWDDFARAFSAASGKDMVSFMAPWLDRKGAPQLSLANVARKEEGRTWLVSGVVEERHPFSPLTVTVRAETAKGPWDTKVRVAGERTPFSFTVTAPPKRLVLDPDSDILRLLEPREIPPSVNRIKGSEALRLIVTAGCRADTETLHGLLTSLGQGRAPILREEDVTAAQLAAHDLIYCGLPATPAALPALPEGTALSPREFTVDRERFAKPGDALFMVLSATRGGGERTVALFLPLSAEAAALSMPKITHYGKFGFLVFEGGTNKAKGLFPPAQGRSVVAF